MAVTQEACPNCGAPVQIPPGVIRMKCPFCSMTLAVERQNGEIALEVANRITGSLERTSAQTQATIQEGTYVTQSELRRLQIAQDLSMAQMRLASIQSEIRAVERSPQTGVTRNQLRELRGQETVLKQQIVALQNVLNPPSATDRAAKRIQSAQRGNLGWQLFGFRGRIDRTAFWIGGFVCFLLFSIASMIAAPSDYFGDAAQDIIGLVRLVSTLAFVLMLWIGLATLVKRYHDRNKSGWWVLIFFVPIIGLLWMLFELGFMRGTPGPNRYG